MPWRARLAALISEVKRRVAQPVTYAEGCFGLFLLREDPVLPLLQFGRGGRPPPVPQGPGLGVTVDEAVLQRWTVEKALITR